jgi:hypothetical protein
MESTAQITTGMLYELLKEFKDEMRNEFRSFKAEVNRRFEGIEQRQAEDHKMLMELWQDRGEIKIKYSKHLFVSVAMLASLVSLIVSVFVVSFG